ncbi:MAG TPA: amidohydrolase/deacetylase family metallohydrolase, partial [Spirochaeta sp.]|nr:amidohydrolase/deacetylase family metallohydrolase [Spirochaeta sp.]
MPEIEKRILLKGGQIIDPANNINQTADVLIKNGKIFSIDSNIPETSSEKVINVTGLIVTPGLVDIHTHLFNSTGVPDSWAGDWSVNPDSFSFRSGTTTMVDAGSAGWKNFDHFRATVIERSKTRVLSFINIVSTGMLTEETEQEHSCYQTDEAVKAVKKHSDIIVGIKTAHYRHP